jgi:hypothetical protein
MRADGRRLYGQTLIKVFRWPELITFEEMNLEIPEESSDELIPNGIIRQYMVQALKDGFINNKFEVFLEKIKNKTA